MLEIYHLSMLNWWRDRLTWNGKPVPLVFASPERAFSEMETILDRSRGTGVVSQMRGGNIPLPFCSLSEVGSGEYDGTRDHAGTMRAAFVTSDLEFGYNVDWPTPIKLTYQLDFWCKTQNQSWFFRDLVRRFFKLQVSYVEIDFNSPVWTTQLKEVPDEVRFLGSRRIPIKVLSWANSSNLEPADGFRDIRVSFSYTADAWMARGYTKVPLVHTIRTELRELGSDALLATFALE